MAKSTLLQLLKKSPPHSRILASLRNPHLLQSPNTNSPIISHHLETKPTENRPTIDGRPFLLGSFKVENLSHLNPWLFSPISPVQLSSYQILSSWSVQDGPNDEESGMWADRYLQVISLELKYEIKLALPGSAKQFNRGDSAQLMMSLISNQIKSLLSMVGVMKTHKGYCGLPSHSV
ncbi:hypothetical protein SADUNF_Sadunf16G0217300 [Salix dunnii]|uniref:Uncharacterized protein n=1 Tax=Salix dunnii TaxID=1413687 RepID=A0A835MHM6_9ROSI|nr:hypothetical protein SADUNF_Sadunf16G0217300 [Salix dunnii]